MTDTTGGPPFQPPAAITCQNCRRIVQPPPARVALVIDGHATETRLLCSACRVHVADEFKRPATWLML